MKGCIEKLRRHDFGGVVHLFSSDLRIEDYLVTLVIINQLVRNLLS